MNLFTRLVENKITEELNRVANDIASQAKSNSSWSSDIPDAISVSKLDKNADRYTIDITVNLKAAPQARAYEYGSGIHRTRGKPGTYRISPRPDTDATMLVFPFTITFMPSPNKLRGVAGIGDWEDVWYEMAVSDHGQISGRMFWNYVDHPGVDARPYLAPAIEESRRSIRNRIVLALLSGIKRSNVQVEFIE